MANNTGKQVLGIKTIEKSDNHYKIHFQTGDKARLYILNNHVFRYYVSHSGVFLNYPKPINPDDAAKIVTKSHDDYGYEAFTQSMLGEETTHYIIRTKDIKLKFDKKIGTIQVLDVRTNEEVLCEAKPLCYKDSKFIQTLRQGKNEYFVGGGMQNGRFSHKYKIIDIVKTNNWNDGGVASPNPFYWSSYGYGILRNTWQPGTYDFSKNSNQFIETAHTGEEYDAYVFISKQPIDILADYYELTGQPLLMPEYAYYEAHLNCFNHYYWVKVTLNASGGILFNDGYFYNKYKPDEMNNKEGILESLNGEKNNYQFSARAFIDRYKKNDFPLGWFIPNDGNDYGYGQTDSVDGDIRNLKEFVNFCLQNGVEVALFTKSNLRPADPLNPKKGERDLSKEVSIANIVGLKCSGYDYSHGLSIVEYATNIFVSEAKSSVRPMIITTNGWAGTQRYSGIWSGNQYGGTWENIRFHIPTYIGACLSGQPIVGSDMDGIFGGGCKKVNVRDIQWKSFTPLQLNMDGWGNTPKTPFSYDEETTYINRAYLKLKSMLMPYNYSIGYEAIKGLPMVRAMFLEFPEETSAYTDYSKYQYMWGPNILVAPIYNDREKMGKSVRDGIYLPNKNQVWIDFFTGMKYQGGKIYYNIEYPLWKIPIFIKEGSILPMTNPNNNPYEIKRENRVLTIYPAGISSFEIYEDDGKSLNYIKENFDKTKVLVKGPTSNTIGDLYIAITKTSKHFKNMIKAKSTLLQIMSSEVIREIEVSINGKPLTISTPKTFAEFENDENSYYFKKDFFINPYLSTYNETMQSFIFIKIKKIDVTANDIIINIKGFNNQRSVFGRFDTAKILKKPKCFDIISDKTNGSAISLKWEETDEAEFYEIERDGVVFSNIIGNTFKFDNFNLETKHEFRIRAVFKSFASEWTTLYDPFVSNVTVKCNLPSQPDHDVSLLTGSNPNTLWHNNWNVKADPTIEKYITLNFDLGDIYELSRADYLPRVDAGNGTFLALRYRYSTNEKDWSGPSELIKFNADNSMKNIQFNFLN